MPATAWATPRRGRAEKTERDETLENASQPTPGHRVHAARPRTPSQGPARVNASQGPEERNGADG